MSRSFPGGAEEKAEPVRGRWGSGVTPRCFPQKGGRAQVAEPEPFSPLGKLRLVQRRGRRGWAELKIYCGCPGRDAEDGRRAAAGAAGARHGQGGPHGWASGRRWGLLSHQQGEDTG